MEAQVEVHHRHSQKYPVRPHPDEGWGTSQLATAAIRTTEALDVLQIRDF